MPRRKSKMTQTQLTRRRMSYAVASVSKMPYRLTMLLPNKPIEGTNDEFIRTRPVDTKEARDIVWKYGERVELVNEQIATDDSFIGEPVVRMPELLIAMEVIPEGNMVLSYNEDSRVKDDLPQLIELGARMTCARIAGNKEDVNDEHDIGYVMDIVAEKNPLLDWTGEVPKRIVDWINLRAYAMGILNCCYIGRGAPAGVNLLEQANEMANNPALLARFVDTLTSSMRQMPNMDSVQLPAWQERLLWNGRIDHRYQKAMKQSENFREAFHYAPLIHQNKEMEIADIEFTDIRQLMYHMLMEYENGEENNIPDIIWTEQGPAQMAEALDEIGIVSTIEAYLAGVPIEDIMV